MIADKEREHSAIVMTWKNKNHLFSQFVLIKIRSYRNGKICFVKVEDFVPYEQVQVVVNGPYAKESLHPPAANTWNKN